MTATFRRAPLGYNKSEVDEYVVQLRAEVDKLRAQTEQLSEKVAEQDAQIQKYREQERFISGAILNAQNQAVEIEKQARENYDQTILRLSEESKVWESRIVKNRERLVTIDGMIQDFLTSIKSEMAAAMAPAMDDWQSVLKPGEKSGALTGGREADGEKAQSAPGGADAEGVETAVEPEYDGDIHSLYWRLKRIETGGEDRAPAEPAPPRPKGRPAQSRDGVFMPAESDQEKLAALCRELGLLK